MSLYIYKYGIKAGMIIAPNKKTVEIALTLKNTNNDE